MSDAAIINFPNKPHDRLRVVLRELETALVDQSSAFQEFRLNLAVLETATGGLERSLEGYRGALDALALDVAKAHHTTHAVIDRVNQGLH